MLHVLRAALLCGTILSLCGAATSDVILTGASVVLTGDAEVLKIPAQVLVEEIAKRTQPKWSLESGVGDGPVVELSLGEGLKPEGYKISTSQAEQPRILITAADRRGALFAVGHLLRKLDWSAQRVFLAEPLNIETAPEYPIRGHQLGYRHAANTYDAWSVEQYDQYIRELALFGTNAIENIPFQDERPSPHMKVSRAEMNRAMSEICAKYDLDYWVWTPADFDLKDAEKRAQALKDHEAFYADCPRLDAVFFPGGDPGDNHPDDVMPFLADISVLLAKHHPKAKVWISLQGFEKEKVDAFYAWVDAHNPDWMGGVVYGPSSPSIVETRTRLNKRYAIRNYPDLTHTVRCQFPAPWLDQAYALTEGREAICPMPVYYAAIHNWQAPFTSGFISYSDGSTDDVNKVTWSAMGWNTRADVREVMEDYARLHFGNGLGNEGADAILALEKNWQGALATNGGVTASAWLWLGLERRHPELSENWRWQMLLLRAYYDQYTRERLLQEEQLEREANAILNDRSAGTPQKAMDAALSILAQADSHSESRARIIELFETLYHSNGYQSSVEKYQASGTERGAMLDFLDYPLNNRWWLEDQFKKIAEMTDVEAQWARLAEIATWEDPGPGGYYDNLGQVGENPHVVPGDLTGDPELVELNNPNFWWWEDGFSRERLSWQVSLDLPRALQYNALDPQAKYTLRFTGFADLKPFGEDQPLEPTKYGKGIGEIKEFPVPASLIEDGELTVTFERVHYPGLNWRQQPRLTEAWLIKK